MLWTILIRRCFEAFPFVDPVDRAVALSAILTAFDRRSMATAPLHAFTAPTAGTGKSKLVNIVSWLTVGRATPATHQGSSIEEFDKHLGGRLLGGYAVINIDNCSHPLDSDLLSQAVTEQWVTVRPLGQSNSIEVPNSAAIYATGNNLQIVGDLANRRSLLCSLDAKCERPYRRRFDFDIEQTIRADRGLLVCAALTVLRAWHAAGTPRSKDLEPIGGFEDWSRRIREPLIWLGRPDPCDTMDKVRETDIKQTLLDTVIQQWQLVIGVNVQRTIQSVLDAALINAEFHSALLAVAQGYGGGFNINNRRLSQWLQSVEGKIVGNLRLVQSGQVAGYSLWKLVSV